MKKDSAATSMGLMISPKESLSYESAHNIRFDYRV